MFIKYCSASVLTIIVCSVLILSMQCQGKDKNRAEGKKKAETAATDTISAGQSNNEQQLDAQKNSPSQKLKVTFIELGSVN